MSKREYFLRYLAIVKKLRSSREANFEEISDYLKRESEFTGYRLAITKRTFQRDLNEIRAIFNVDIQNRKSGNVYFIAEEGPADMNNRMLESFDMLNFFSTAEGYSKSILFEKRHPQGTEHLFGILHAIKNQVVLKFKHQKFWEEQPSHRAVEPVGIKEFKSRWYLLCWDKKDGKFKTFGIDRISNLQITKEKCTKKGIFSAEGYFSNSYGIINPVGEDEPKDIVLSFTYEEGKYIKSLPLHWSQKVLIDNDEEFRISIHVYVTYDLIIELLSHGEELKIISPVSLKNKVVRILKNALEQYN